MHAGRKCNSSEMIPAGLQLHSQEPELALLLHQAGPTLQAGAQQDELPFGVKDACFAPELLLLQGTLVQCSQCCKAYTERNSTHNRRLEQSPTISS